MTKQQIKAACTYAGISVNQLAAEINQTQPNLFSKIQRETLKDNELKEIAAAIGAKYFCYFEFEDGTRI